MRMWPTVTQVTAHRLPRQAHSLIVLVLAGAMLLLLVSLVSGAPSQGLHSPADRWSPEASGPQITGTTIIETSPYLYSDGWQLFYSDLMSGGQQFWLGGYANGTDLERLVCSAAFGEGPFTIPVFVPMIWECGPYVVESTDSWEGNISASLYDIPGGSDVQFFPVYRDTAPPSSSASPPALSNGTIAIPWSGVDAGSSVYPAGVERACLFYRQDGQQDWFPGPCQNGSSGVLDFTPDGGDDEYYFQTIAVDNVGNMEPPGSGDGSTIYDTTALSHAEAPAISNYLTIPVSFTVEPDASGLDHVRLHYRINGGSWVETAYIGWSMSGVFDFDPPDGDGVYDFQSIAVDNLGNVEDGPTAPGDASTLYDTTAPTVSVITPPSVSSLSWQVSWEGVDPDTGSGIDWYDVQYQVNGAGWNDWVTGTTQGSQTFGPYLPVEVQNSITYTFRARAQDIAGNPGSYSSGASTVVNVRYVYLPVVAKPDPHPFEENDNWGEAYGPLQSGKPYLAFPEDQYDFYYILLASEAEVRVSVTNFLPLSTNGTVALYREDYSYIDHFGYLGYRDMVLPPHLLQAGKYYVLIHTAPGHFTNAALYNLSVSW